MANEREDFPEYEEVDLIQLVNVMLKRRWMIILGVLVCVIFAVIYSISQPPVYTASAKFLPSKNTEMISRMGTLIGALPLSSLEGNSASEYYIELLKSSSFLERIANKKFLSKKLGKKVDLSSYYQVEADNNAQKLLMTIRIINNTLTVSTESRSKVILISYSTSEPELSAAIVNAFLEELVRYNQDIRNTKSKQNRIFIENQTEESSRLLNDAEVKLADFTARNKKIVTPDLEIELDRLKRNVKVQEEVYVTLKKQLELAKIEEQEKKPAIEILKKASPPLYKSSPSTKRNVIISIIAGLFLFLILAFILEFLSKINPEEERYKEFYRHLSDIKNDFKVLNTRGGGKERK